MICRLDDTWPRTVKMRADVEFDEIKFEPSRDLKSQKIADMVAESASWKQPNIKKLRLY